MSQIITWSLFGVLLFSVVVGFICSAIATDKILYWIKQQGKFPLYPFLISVGVSILPPLGQVVATAGRTAVIIGAVLGLIYHFYPSWGKGKINNIIAVIQLILGSVLLTFSILLFPENSALLPTMLAKYFMLAGGFLSVVTGGIMLKEPSLTENVIEIKKQFLLK